MAAAPARISSRVVRAIEKAAPQPVSASTSNGSWHGRRDPPYVLADIIEGRYAKIGQAEGGVGNAGPGKIDRLETAPGREQRAVRVDCADDLERPFVLDGGAELLSGRVGRHASMITS